ncbi:DoxX family membrane protein [Flavitalea sp. BT771]|uniref:DoxX family membrane protein n=1 Tax=Flavitalea sp. BT771 TaxID=3063329 RepID=UPI0026E20D45|nr:DoxX family membrane protein [Flavitalea sp. BT771]MDO6434341.1 DoxX family membrane protein [Flavitalea sp. BT771]MDV6223241.1 DoxX family membrane protein [Flavitalea sp. BT771]
MDNATISKIGTIFYALVIGFFGLNHFMNGTGMAKMVPRFLPGGEIWVYLTGAALLLAAISFLINKYTRLAGLLLALFLLLIVLTVHLPAVLNAPDESARRFPMVNLIKDTGLAAAALLVASRH